jgi:dienelactone hydrolase
MVHNYYLNQVYKISDDRMEQRAKIRTKKDAEKLVTTLRSKLTSLFLPFPEKTPLKTRLTGIQQCRGYRIEKIIFQSRPGFPVTANAYVPDGRNKKFPAVLGVCGHSMEGKAADAYQSFSQGLVLHGYVVLIYDPISQGERIQIKPGKDPLIPKGCTEEHNNIGVQMHLVEEFMGSWMVWDGIRALDCLLARPEVDPTHVGVTGSSGGGMLTAYLNMIEPRFTMAAPSCYITSFRRNIDNELPTDTEQCPPGILKAGLDMPDMLIARAPRPVIILAQEKDFFDPRGTIGTFNEVKRIYKLLGAEENIQLFFGPEGHGYFKPAREAMYAFFNKQTGEKRIGKEPSLHLNKIEQLYSTAKGQIYFTPYKKVFDFIRTEAENQKKSRQKLTWSALLQAVHKLLKIKADKTVPEYKVLGSDCVDKKHGLFKNRFGVQTEPGVETILSWLTLNEETRHFPKTKEITLYVPHLSATLDIQKGFCADAMKKGTTFTCEPRGIGESLPQTCEFLDFYHKYDADYFYSAIGIMLDKPYLGGKVTDLLGTINLLHDKGYKKINLMARGLGTIPASFAAMLSPHISNVTLINALRSYHELTQHETFKWPLSHIVRGVLKHFDLPDIHAELKKKKHLRMIKPWDHSME